MLAAPPLILAVICAISALSFYLQRLGLFARFGPGVLCILFGMAASNTGIMPFTSPVYDGIGTHLISLSIAMLLLDLDIRSLRKLSLQPFSAIFFACVSVCLVAFAAGCLLAPQLGKEGWKLAGMIVGTYTGGSDNLNAIGIGLNASSDLVAAANVADYVVYTPFIIAMMALGTSLKNIRWFARLWPYSVPDSILTTGKDEGFLEAKNWSVRDIAWLLALSFAVIGVAGFIAEFFSSNIAGAVRVLCITTFAIILAQLPLVKSLRGATDLGFLFSMMYLTKIGLEISFSAFFDSAVPIVVYCAIVIVGAMTLHVAFCRLFKIPWQYVLLSIQAAVGSSSSASVLAISSGWGALVGVAVALGVIGHAAGTYLGFAVALTLKALGE